MGNKQVKALVLLLSLVLALSTVSALKNWTFQDYNVDIDGKLNVDGSIASPMYCDENGQNCKTLSEILDGGKWNESATALFPKDLSKNVGIGTTNPSRMLTVKGTTSAILLDGTNSLIDIDRASTSNAGEIRYLTAGDRKWVAGISNDVVVGDGSEYFIGQNPGGSDAKLWIESSGYIGIGTNAPQSKLNVVGGSLAIGNTESNQKSLVLDTDGYMGQIAGHTALIFSTNHLNLGVDAGEKMRLTNTGRLGIGTSVPAAKLDVNELNAAGASYPMILRNQDMGIGTSVGIKFSPSTSSSRYSAIQGVQENGQNVIGLSLLTGAGSAITEKMRITGTGNVGIGTSLPSAGLKLDVEGNIGAAKYCDNNGQNCKTLSEIMDSGKWNESATAFYPKDLSKNVGIGTSNPQSKLEIVSSNDSFSNIISGINKNSGFALYEGNSGGLGFKLFYEGASSNNFQIQSKPLGSTEFVNRLTIKRDNGFVGIGKTSPVEMLDVEGNVKAKKMIVGDSVSGGGAFVAAKFSNNIGYNTGSEGGPVRIDLGRGTKTHGYIESGSWSDSDSSRGYLALGNLQPTNDLKEAMRINYRGDVGIGTTTPSAGLKLDVEGKIGATEICDENGENCKAITGLGVADQLALQEGTVTRIVNPKGATFTASGDQTGAFRIKLPYGGHNTMLKMTVEIYDYTNDEAMTVKLGGYSYSSPSWINTFAQIIGSKVDRDVPISFAYEGSDAVIYIGNATTNWDYPKVMVTSVETTYSNYQAEYWDDGWEINMTTSFGDITKTHTNNLIASDWNKMKNIPAELVDGNFVKKSGDTMTGVLEISKNTEFPLILDSAGVNREKIGIQFESSGVGQKGYFVANHLNTQSPSGAYSFHVGSTELSTDFVLDGGGDFFVDSNKVWHKGNDGMGSTLDADLLDGHDSAFFIKETGDTMIGDLKLQDSDLSWNDVAYNFTAAPRTQTSPMSLRMWDNYNNNQGPTAYGTLLDIYGKSGHENSQLYFGHDSSIHYRDAFYNEDTFSPWYEVWTSKSDGAGSGLDADTLDGYNSSDFLNSGVQGTGTANYIPVWNSDGKSLGNSVVRQGGNNIGIGADPQAKIRLDVRSIGSEDGSVAVAGYGYNGNGGSAILGTGYASSGTGTSTAIRGVSGGPRTTGTNIGGYFSATNGANHYALITGNGNVGIGTDNPSQKLDVNGNINVADGSAYMYGGTSALKLSKGTDSWYSNVAVGMNAGNSTAQRQTAVGEQAGRFGTGASQSAFGWYAGKENTGGAQTAIGFEAGYKNTGSYQTATGHLSGYQNTGSYQTANGFYAGRENTGAHQTIFGAYSGYKNIGNYQTAVGYSAGKESTGSSQTTMGYNSGVRNTGLAQTALGANAGFENTGAYQTALGANAGYNNTGENLVAIGNQAGKNNAEDNKFIVQQANVNSVPLIKGDFATGDVNIAGSVNAGAFIGDGSGLTNLSLDSLDMSDYYNKTETDNKILDGVTGAKVWDKNGNSAYYNDGKVGIGTNNPGAKFQVVDAGSVPGGHSVASFRQDDDFTVGLIVGNDAVDSAHYRGLKLSVDSNAKGKIETYNNAAYQDLLLNPNAGNVGIGITSPKADLDVDSDFRFNTQYFSKSAYSYSNGILIETDIDATNDNRMIELDIYGNSYNPKGPINTKIQAYNYLTTGTIGQTSAISYGPNFDVDVFHYNDKVYFWFQQYNSYETLRFRLGTNTGRHKIVSIANVAKPTTGVTNSVTITPMKGWYSGNDGAGSGLDADLLDGHDSAYFAKADDLATSGKWNESATAFYPKDLGKKVGIGTNNPQDKLDVAGGIRLSSNGVFSNNIAQIYKDSNLGLVLTGTSGTVSNFAVTSPNGARLIENPTGSSNLVLGPTGSVKVGIGTSSPTGKLFVGSDWRTTNGGTSLFVGNRGTEITSTTDLGITYSGTDTSTAKPGKVGLTLYNDDTTAGGWSPMMVFAKAESGASNYKSSIAAIAAKSPLGTGNGDNWIDGELHFYTSGAGTTGLVDRMVIDKEGSVGVGTDAPTEKLDVRGNIKTNGSIQFGDSVLVTDANGDVEIF